MSHFITAVVSAVVGSMLTWIVRQNWEKYLEKRDKKKIYEFLQENTADRSNDKFKDTCEIANNVNLPESRVYYICCIHKKIDQCIQERDHWGIYGPEKTSVYEECGIRTI